MSLVFSDQLWLFNRALKLMNNHSLKILVFMPDNGQPGMDGTTSDAINIAQGFAQAAVSSIFFFSMVLRMFSKNLETPEK